MADIVFRYVEMRQAAGDIRDLADDYEKASTSFQVAFSNSIADWEGDTKEAVSKFIAGSVAEYTGTTVPGLLNALASLLDANADQMEKADKQIAENIPTNLGAEQS